MKILTGKVVDGKVEVSGIALEEGASVTVVVPESEEFSLTPKQEAELVRAHEEIERGDFVEGGDLLAQLRSQTDD
jgi:hypothetical protein